MATCHIGQHNPRFCRFYPSIKSDYLFFGFQKKTVYWAADFCCVIYGGFKTRSHFLGQSSIELWRLIPLPLRAGWPCWLASGKQNVEEVMPPEFRDGPRELGTSAWPSPFQPELPCKNSGCSNTTMLKSRGESTYRYLEGPSCSRPQRCLRLQRIPEPATVWLQLCKRT